MPLPWIDKKVEDVIASWAVDELIGDDGVLERVSKPLVKKESKMKKDSMIAVIVHKTDNGFNGTIVRGADNPALSNDKKLFNRQFYPFPKGTHMRVSCTVSKTGRVMVKHVEKETEVTGEELLEEVRRLSEKPPTPMAKEVLEKGDYERKLVTIPVGAVTMEVEDFEGKVVYSASGTGSFKLSEPYSREELGLPDTLDGWGTEGEGENQRLVRKARPKKEKVVEKQSSPLDGYYISQEARLAFTTAYNMSKVKPERAIKLMMIGGSGFGKTMLPRLMSQVTGMQFLRMDCAKIRDPEEWFGYREAREGSTVFIRSRFAKAIEEGNLVVVLDEFNRLEPWLHNTLFPLLDDDGCTVVHDEEFRIGSNVIVVGTINTGYRYTGTFELDEALLNRFDLMVEVGAMPHNEEVRVLRNRTGIDKELAQSLVKVCNTLRSIDVVCSTRSSLKVAEMVMSGMTLREALEYAVVRRIPPDTSGNGLRKSAVDAINAAIGVMDVRKLTDDVFASFSADSAGKEEDAPMEIPETGRHVKLQAADLSAEGLKNLPLVRIVSLIRHVNPHYSIKTAKTAFGVLLKGTPYHLTVSEKVSDAVLTGLVKDFTRVGITVTMEA